MKFFVVLNICFHLDLKPFSKPIKRSSLSKKLNVIIKSKVTLLLCCVFCLVIIGVSNPKEV